MLAATVKDYPMRTLLRSALIWASVYVALAVTTVTLRSFFHIGPDLFELVPGTGFARVFPVNAAAGKLLATYVVTYLPILAAVLLTGRRAASARLSSLKPFTRAFSYTLQRP